MLSSPWMRWTLLTIALLAFILVPFALFEPQVRGWTQAVLDSDRSKPVIAAVLAGLLAGDIFLPVPSSLVSTAAGYLLGLFPGVVVSWIGMTIGCGLGYLSGRWAGWAGLARFVGEPELARVLSAREHYGDWMLVLFRAVPVLAEASVILAGLTRMPPFRFIAVTSAANLGISVAYGAVGAFAVRADSFLLAFTGAILVPVGFLCLARLLRP